MIETASPAPLTLLQRLWRFGLAGVLGLLVDAALLYLLAPFLGWYGARLMSFWAAASATWAVNRRYTFADGAAPVGPALLREYGSYLLAMLGGAAVNYGVYALTLQLLGEQAFVPLVWVPLIGVAAGSLAGMGINFYAARRLIFRTRG